MSFAVKSLRIIFYVLISVLLFNCSNENEDENVNLTFAEKYDGTIWKNEYEKEFLKVINDNKSNLLPYENWQYWSGDIFNCYKIIRFPRYGHVKINLNNTFQYEWTSTTIYGYTNTYLTTVTVDGDILTKENKVYSFDKWRNNGYEKYKRYLGDLDTLPMCGD